MEDEETAFYRAYCTTNDEREEGYILCDFCFREKKQPTWVKVSEAMVKKHFSTQHCNKKLDFACETCKMMFASAGDAGKHEFFVHNKKITGWWRQPATAMEEKDN